MKVALINIIQHRQLAKKEFAPDRYFNPIIDEMGNILITEWEIEGTENADYLWVKDLPLVEHSDVLNPPSYTPPPSNGYGIEIEAKYQWAFPVKINGYVVELKTHIDGRKYCESSQMGWTDFVAEFDKPQNIDHRDSLLEIWQYALTKVANNDYIIL